MPMPGRKSGFRGSGWTRIDPTASVAPERVEQGAVESLDQRRYMLDFQWLRNARNTFDLFQRGWNNWVVTFGSDRQSRLFSIFGWELVGPARLVIAMIAIILIIGAIIFMLAPLLLKFRSSKKPGSIAALMEKIHQETGQGRLCFTSVDGCHGTRRKCKRSIKLQWGCDIQDC